MAKTHNDKRHLARMAMVQALFIDEWSGQDWDEVDFPYDKEILAEIREKKAEYDAEIQAVAKERPLSELSRIDVVILRLMLHEHKTKKTPIKVLIDEGVELAQDFGGENTYAFVNAVLQKLFVAELNNSDDDNKSE
jgi:N utilization substance protein B